MLDKMAMSKRFFSSYEDKSRRDVALIFGVRKGTVTTWANKGTVPWSKLKYLCESQAVSWDWLIEGRKPKGSEKEPVLPSSTSPEFDREGINERFLSLFPKRSQTEIAKALRVAPATVHEWMTNQKPVGWLRLDNAVHMFGIRWDWLVDGYEPKFSGLTHIEPPQKLAILSHFRSTKCFSMSGFISVI